MRWIIYILKRFIIGLILSIIVLIPILLSDRLFYLNHLAKDWGFPISGFIKIILYLLPNTVLSLLPLATAFSITIALGNMDLSSLRSTSTALLPLFLLTALISFGTSHYYRRYYPHFYELARSEYQKTKKEPLAYLEPAVFKPVHNFFIRVGEIQKGGNIGKVAMFYRDDHHGVITASQGKIETEDHRVILELYLVVPDIMTGDYRVELPDYYFRSQVKRLEYPVLSHLRDEIAIIRGHFTRPWGKRGEILIAITLLSAILPLISFSILTNSQIWPLIPLLASSLFIRGSVYLHSQLYSFLDTAKFESVLLTHYGIYLAPVLNFLLFLVLLIPARSRLRLEKRRGELIPEEGVLEES